MVVRIMLNRLPCEILILIAHEVSSAFVIMHSFRGLTMTSYLPPAGAPLAERPSDCTRC